MDVRDKATTLAGTAAVQDVLLPVALPVHGLVDVLVEILVEVLGVVVSVVTEQPAQKKILTLDTPRGTMSG